MRSNLSNREFTAISIASNSTSRPKRQAIWRVNIILNELLTIFREIFMYFLHEFSLV